MRVEKYLYPQREPVATRPAATVLLMRPAQAIGAKQSYEILMTRRSEKASFAPGVYVFPGGVVDPGDSQATEQLTFGHAAIRESFEELGVLLARRADGQWASQADINAMVRQPADGFGAELLRHGLTPALDAVSWLCHWTTDRDMPKRFDTRFYIARMPEGQEAIADDAEQFEPTWITPTDALERYAAGTMKMIFPTIRTLERMKEMPTIDAVFASCEKQPIIRSCPRAAYVDINDSRHMEYEPVFGELEFVSPDGQIKHRTNWQSTEPRALAKHIQRLTAPNPSVMTGPGTNTYIIGETSFIVIDPGPADEAHIQRLAAIVGNKLQWILCTHSHADHSPGAARLKQLTGHSAKIAGMKSQPTARPNSEFTPEIEISNGQIFHMDGTTLRAVHTPGHAANHVCFVMEEDKVLISGDHILNGSTTVIDPPDGNMNDYLNSLDILLAQDVEYIFPAHGYVLGSAKEAITKLKTHRLAREAKVRAAMEALPEGSMMDWVKLAYADTDVKLHPVALRSLTAHVERIRLIL